jgi:adenosylcobyric acid synthase
MPSIMVQGTASGVGKSTLVAALCRILRQDGLRVAPFKAQNMANNAHVCAGGGEIGRATALQALAAGIEPHVDLNPVLLKPSADAQAQVVLMGRPVRSMSAVEYMAEKPRLLGVVKGCLDRLRAAYDVVVIEGAGSPAEPNLRESDFVNMRTAEMADAPVLLAADIDAGGVFAHILGTLHLLSPAERARVRGFLINKFRGDLGILRPALDFLERETGRPVLGVVPHIRLRLPEEDALPRRESGAGDGRVRIDVLLQSRMANFTDFDPLEREPDVRLRYVSEPDGTIPDAVILPGTKTTITDLRRLKDVGFASHLKRCVELGATVVGVCGGFQMLGTRVLDPERVESESTSEAGFGLLSVETVFGPGKITRPVRALHLESGAEVRGYEIHVGRTSPGPDPVLRIVERDGTPSEDFDGAAAGRVWGTYVHGLFDAPGFRRAFVNKLRAARGWAAVDTAAAWDPETELNRLADHVRAAVDMGAIRRLIEEGNRHGV